MPDATTPPRYYPVCLDLCGTRVLVVGGSAVARRKVEGLLAAGAAITVVAPQVVPMPEEVQIVRRPYCTSDLDGVLLVFAATDDAAVNAQVAQEASARGIWANVVDDPHNSSFVVPAVLQRGALQIAVSTSGASPLLARVIRDELTHQYDERYEALTALLWQLRQEWDGSGLNEHVRRQRWAQVIQQPLLTLIGEGKIAEAEALARAVLKGEGGEACNP